MLRDFRRAVPIALEALVLCLPTTVRAQSIDNLGVENVDRIQAEDNLVAFTFREGAARFISVHDAAAGATRVLGQGPLCASDFSTGSKLVAFTLHEDDQAPQPADLNGDGDTDDDVLHVYSSEFGDIENLQLVPVRPDCAAPDPTQEFRVSGDFVAFRASEVLSGVDYNEDGDLNDSVLMVYDAATGVTANLGLAITPGYHWSGDVLAFAVSEPAQGADFTGDGVPNDSALHLYDASTRTLTNLELAVVDWRISGRRVAFSAANTLAVYDIDSDTIDLVQRTIRSFDFAGHLAVFSANELDENRDLDGNGQVQDVSVLHVYDVDTQNVANLGRVVDDLFGDQARISEGGFVVLRVREADQAPANSDLNGDGDASDEVLQVYNALTGSFSAAWAAEPTFRFDRSRVAFAVIEIFENHDGPGGSDLNEDTDALDRVAHVLDVGTDTVQNLKLAVDLNSPGFGLLADTLVFLVDETGQQQNLNALPPDGDMDTTDFVLHTWSAATGQILNLGLEAFGGPKPVASSSVVAFVVHEARQSDDLNGDMDRVDPFMIHVADFFPPNSPGDEDGDGIDDAIDNCPDAVNFSQSDRDGDELGDVCDPDDDNDGVLDDVDNCLRDANADQLDTDGDGAGDICEIDDDNDGLNDDRDNCPLSANPDQNDLDEDGIGDVCDPDEDGDGVPNAEDNCPLDANGDQGDLDGDGIGDVCDPLTDTDDDGIADDLDNCPVDANAGQSDVDADNHGDACDLCPLGAACVQGPVRIGGGSVNLNIGLYDVFLDVEPAALAEPTEISISSLGRLGPVEMTASLGDAIAAFELEPDGLLFQIPASLQIFIFDFATLDSLSFEQLAELNLYQLRDDGLYELVPGAFCEGSPVCSADIQHLSRYAIVVPLDSDGDGMFDDFGGEVDPCPDDPDNTCDVIGDGDGDGVLDDVDNCPDQANPDQVDLDTDGEGDVCDGDDDNDGVDDAQDNCPADANSQQSDLDMDGLGDVCDPCHADETDTCEPKGSAAAEISPDGGSLGTGDGAVQLDFEQGDLAGTQTISVTSGVGGAVALANSLGDAIAIFDFQPDGLAFANPVALTITADVSSLNPSQRENLDIYTLVDGVFEALGAACEVVEEPVSVFVATCTAEILHFSQYALVTPLDTDDDEVFDQFGDDRDNCPDVANPDQEDFDGDLFGDACDDDADDDGVANSEDQCPKTPLDTLVDPQSGCPIEEICEELLGQHSWWTWFFEKLDRHGLWRHGYWRGFRHFPASDHVKALCREVFFEKIEAKLEELRERLEKKKRRHHSAEHHRSSHRDFASHHEHEKSSHRNGEHRDRD